MRHLRKRRLDSAMSAGIAAARPAAAVLEAAFGCADRLRRARGDALEVMGFGPVMMPSRVALSLPGLRLRDYGGAAEAPVFVAVAAPIKRAYIWDLAPEASVMRRLRAAGWHPFLVDWADDPGQAHLDLADYADRLLLAAVEAAARRAGERRVVLAGHSLGGTLAAIFAALHPERVGALVLLEAPTSFAKAGAFAPCVAATPAGGVAALFDRVPGSLLDLISIAASPMSFTGALWLDRLAVAGAPRALLRHWRVARWTFDERPLAAGLLGEIVDRLYREDRFLRGTLSVAGRRATPAALAMPLLAVLRPESLIIPPAAVRPLYDAAPSRNKRLLCYEGEHGAGLRHVGILVGERAHREVWPEILAWARRCAAPTGRDRAAPAARTRRRGRRVL